MPSARLTVAYVVGYLVLVGWVAAAFGGAPAEALTVVALATGLALPGPMWMRPITVAFIAVEVLWVDGFFAMSHWRDGNPLFGQDSVFGNATVLASLLVVPALVYWLAFYAANRRARSSDR
jgi:hypothetical protein